MSPYLVLDPRFEALIAGTAQLEKLWTGGRWLEGPAYVPAGRYLVVSDIPNDRLLRFDETDGSVSVFRQPCNNENGHTVDREGRLVACEHRGRCVSRTEHDGSRTVLADRWRGKRLNSPNDVVVASDGGVWFTDPTYGIDSDYEGDKAVSEIGAANVYRIDPASGAVEAVVTDMVRPNGLAFSPNETRLYVADTGRTHVRDMEAVMRVYDVAPDLRSVANGRRFATCDASLFDGLRLDVEGNVWTSAGDGVRVHAPDGAHLGTVRVPERVANVCFGGAKRNRLFICATTSLYAIMVRTNGALRPPRP
jgi:gluconolactonase